MMVLSGRIAGVIAAAAMSVIVSGASAQTQTPDATAAVPAAQDTAGRLASETVEQFLLRVNATAPETLAAQTGAMAGSGPAGLSGLIAFSKLAAAQSVKDSIREGLEAAIDADADAMAQTIETLVVVGGAVDRSALDELIAFARTQPGEPLAAFLGDALALIATSHPALAATIRSAVDGSELASLKESFADSAVETAAGPGAAAGGGGGSIGGAGAGAAGGGATSGGADFSNEGTVQTAGVTAPEGGNSFSLNTTTTSNISPSSP